MLNKLLVNLTKKKEGEEEKEEEKEEENWRPLNWAQQGQEAGGRWQVVVLGQFIFLTKLSPQFLLC